MSSVRPDRHFFIVGAQRSGTTYLASLLHEHPEVEMATPLRPEPKFFLRDDFPSLRSGDYESLYFGPKLGAARRGEKCTSYMEQECVPRRIAAWYPGAQLIFLLRHPAARAVSNYHYSRGNGFETLPMAEAFASGPDRVARAGCKRTSASPFAYLERGRYLSHIRRFEDHFEPSQFTILIFEEFIGRLAETQALYRTLGVADNFAPRAVFDPAINASEKAAGPAAPDLWRFLVDYYARSIAELEDYLGREIPAWRSVKK